MVGFIDVGGGTRGIFGAGVFDYCIEHGITCDYFVGVSAGSANGTSLLSGQKGRNYTYYSEYAFRKEYMGMGNLLRTGSYIGLDYIYRTLSNADGEYPLDYPAFAANPSGFLVVATDAVTGKPVYFDKSCVKQNDYSVMCASCCVPVVCKPYPIGEGLYYDGGISDPIPFQKAFDAGCDKVVLVLTKPKDAFRKTTRDAGFSRLIRKQYPEAARAMANRAFTYNRSLRKALRLEKEGKLLIIAPDDIGKLKTLTKDHAQLEKMYRMGYEKAEAIEAYLR